MKSTVIIDLGDFADSFNERRAISAELRSRLRGLSCREHHESPTVQAHSECLVRVHICCGDLEAAVQRALD